MVKDEMAILLDQTRDLLLETMMLIVEEGDTTTSRLQMKQASAQLRRIEGLAAAQRVTNRLGHVRRRELSV